MKELPFKPGDIVKCTFVGGVKVLELGQTYTIKRCYMDKDNDCMVEIADLRENNGYYAKRFELIESRMEDTRPYLEIVAQ